VDWYYSQSWMNPRRCYRYRWIGRRLDIEVFRDGVWSQREYARSGPEIRRRSEYAHRQAVSPDVHEDVRPDWQWQAEDLFEIESTYHTEQNQ